MIIIKPSKYDVCYNCSVNNDIHKTYWYVSIANKSFAVCDDCLSVLGDQINASKKQVER